MTDLRQTAGAVGIILFLTALLTVAAFVVCAIPTLLADWLITSAIPAAKAWAVSHPNERDILTIGVLALLALGASQIRGRR